MERGERKKDKRCEGDANGGKRRDERGDGDGEEFAASFTLRNRPLAGGTWSALLRLRDPEGLISAELRLCPDPLRRRKTNALVSRMAPFSSREKGRETHDGLDESSPLCTDSGTFRGEGSRTKGQVQSSLSSTRETDLLR